MNRRTLFAQAARATAAAAGAAGMLTAFAGKSFADDWCDVDPLVKVTTPGGSKEFVHITFSAPSTTYRQNLIDAKDSISWTAVNVTVGGVVVTDVTVTSTVPLNGLAQFETRATISTNPFGGGTVYGSTNGLAGQPMVITYRLNVA